MDDRVSARFIISDAPGPRGRRNSINSVSCVCECGAVNGQCALYEILTAK
jgi:hypothetical protein